METSSIDTRIINAMETVLGTGNAAIEEGLEEIVVEMHRQTKGYLPNAALSETFATRVSGRGLPHWINPFHFNHNYAFALAALEELDLLLEEHDSYIQRELQSEYFIATAPDQATQDRLKNIAKGYDFSARIKSVSFRIYKKLQDLFDYTKAAQVGAAKLFKFDFTNQASNSPSLDGLSQVRELLRNLGERYRNLLPSIEFSTHHISLKRACKAGTDERIGDFFPNPWNSPINDLEVTFNCRNVREFQDYEKLYILDIGLQVIDGSSCYNIRDTEHIEEPNDFWNLTLSPSDREVRILEQLDSPVYTLPVLKYKSIPGTVNNNSAVYSGNPRISGAEANVEWALNIERYSSRNHEATAGSVGIFDIFIYFKVMGFKA